MTVNEQLIYEALDRSGLTASNFLTSKQSMQKTVSTVRMRLVAEIVELIKKEGASNE